MTDAGSSPSRLASQPGPPVLAVPVLAVRCWASGPGRPVLGDGRRRGRVRLSVKPDAAPGPRQRTRSSAASKIPDLKSQTGF